MTVKYHPEAQLAIQKVYDDTGRDQLADRLEELLELLEDDPGNKRLRRHRMQKPAYWVVRVFGSGEEFAFMWEERHGDIWVIYAGDFSERRS